MDIKQINLEGAPLSHKIIENGDQPFRLWLEFEISSPWDDLENDQDYNIHAETPDSFPTHNFQGVKVVVPK